MSQLEQEMRELEVSIEEAEKTVNKSETLRRLMTNPDWIAIIETDYLREEAIRLAHLLNHPDAAMDAKQKFIRADLEGIGALKRYLFSTLQLGSMAADMIVSHKNELDELRQFEANGGDEGEIE